MNNKTRVGDKNTNIIFLGIENKMKTKCIFCQQLFLYIRNLKYRYTKPVFRLQNNLVIFYTHINSEFYTKMCFKICIFKIWYSEITKYLDKG